MPKTPHRNPKRRYWHGIWKILLTICLASFSPPEARSHFIETPDVETASGRYKKRFASRTGKWFIEQQRDSLLSMLAPWPAASILDVGGGHGQYTNELLNRGYSLTVMGSAIEADTQIRDYVSENRCRYAVGNLSCFPFADKSFDIVISFRLMTHLANWEDLIAQSCRVAKHAVILDFPITKSFNITYPLFFKLKKKLEGNSTRPFNVFEEQKVLELFQLAGFSPTTRYAQYFFPMVLHRILYCSPMSINLERVCRSFTLTDRFGSPIILRAEPNSGTLKSPSGMS